MLDIASQFRIFTTCLIVDEMTTLFYRYLSYYSYDTSIHIFNNKKYYFKKHLFSRSLSINHFRTRNCVALVSFPRPPFLLPVSSQNGVAANRMSSSCTTCIQSFMEIGQMSKLSNEGHTVC
jgi:hypothetical protein